MKRIPIPLLAALVLLIAPLCAQETPADFRSVMRIGIFGAPQMNLHSGNYDVVEGNVVCATCTFENGNMFSYRLGALVEMPLTPTLLLSARLGIQDYSGMFERDVRLGSVAQPTGPPADLLVHQTFDNTISYLLVSPGVLFFPIEESPFHLQAGLGFGFPMSKDYSLTEKILSPANKQFSDGSTEHVPFSGEIQDINGIRLALDLGAGYDFPLSRTMLLTPEFGFSFPLTKVNTAADWRASGLALGLALKYAFLEPIAPPPPPQIAPLAVDFDMEGKTAEGGPTRVSPITVDEIRIGERYPLLTYVFFNEGDAMQPLRQNLLTPEQALAFRVEDATGDELGLYKNMLNIVGRRMKDNPRTKITITGNNADAGLERGASALSKQRAENVRAYFTDVWGIDPRRITIKSRNLPADPSAKDSPEGQEENRRVEITSDDPTVTAPIRRDEIVYKSSLAAAEFIPKLDAPNGLERWSLTAKQDNRILYSQDGGTTIPAAFTWSFTGETFKRNSAPIQVALFARDKKAQEKSATRTITVDTRTLERKREERIGGIRVTRSKLILYDFNSSTVSPRNKAIIREDTSSITPTSKVTIVGYTDRLGDPDYNVRLSQQRADNARIEIQALRKSAQIETKGVGSTQLLFSNDTPEGRFYCRMVTVTIETPEE